MKVSHLGPALVVSLALAASALPALAQHHRGGGHRGGHGGGHAVPRSSVHRGGGPAARHPAPGTGYRHYSGHYGGRYGRHYGGHWRSHSGHYYGRSGHYYGGYSYYRPYYYGYRPYYSGSLYVGGPYYSSPYYSWPYSTAYSYYVPSVSLSYNAAPSYASDERPIAPSWDAERDPAPAEARDSGWVRLEVRPEDTSVYVDDQFHGTARESRSVQLTPGLHTIELVRPGYVTERRELRIATGGRYDVFVELQRPR